MQDKKVLRSEFERKRSLFAAEHENDWLLIQEQVNQNIARVIQELPAGALILSYQALRKEADPSLTARKQSSRRWAYPKINGDHMEFFEPMLGPEEDGYENQFAKAQLGILEPIPEKCRKVDVSEASAVLIPGMAFDLNGQRLGRGKGHYDRALTQMPQALRIGVSFNCQLSFKTLPLEAHDQQMHFIVTEELIWCPHWETWMPHHNQKQQQMEG